MLKTMRDSFHHLKWTLWVVVIVFVLSFVYLSGSTPDPSNRASQVIAKVGSTEITGAEFERIYQARLDNYRQQYRGGLTPEMLRFLDLPRQVLDGIIQRKLELEEARRLNLKVSNDEVARAVMSYPAFQDNGQFIGREKYVQLLIALRLHGGSLRGGAARGPAGRQVRRARAGLDPRPRDGARARVRGPQRQGHDRVHPHSRQPARSRLSSPPTRI